MVTLAPLYLGVVADVAEREAEVARRLERVEMARPEQPPPRRERVAVERDRSGLGAARLEHECRVVRRLERQGMVGAEVPFQPAERVQRVLLGGREVARGVQREREVELPIGRSIEKRDW